MNEPTHILISRPDNLGDVLMTKPLSGALKQLYPSCKITYLVRRYAEPLVHLFPEVDHIVFFDDLKAMSKSEIKAHLNQYKFDVFINCAHMKITAQWAKWVNIPVRIGAINRVYNWFTCNKFVLIDKNKSKLHEVQHNLKYLRAFTKLSHLPDRNEVAPTLELLSNKAPDFSAWIPNNESRFKLMLHPGSNGNGRLWPPDCFKHIINSLDPDKWVIYLTGSPKEKEHFGEAFKDLPNHVINTMGAFSLEDLFYFINDMDGVICSGTGPLHMAAALGVHTLGLFPPKRGINQARWGAIGKKAKNLEKPIDTNDGICDIQCDDAHCACMDWITPERVLETIQPWPNEKHPKEKHEAAMATAHQNTL